MQTRARVGARLPGGFSWSRLRLRQFHLVDSGGKKGWEQMGAAPAGSLSAALSARASLPPPTSSDQPGGGLGRRAVCPASPHAHLLWGHLLWARTLARATLVSKWDCAPPVPPGGADGGLATWL